VLDHLAADVVDLQRHDDAGHVVDDALRDAGRRAPTATPRAPAARSDSRPVPASASIDDARCPWRRVNR